MQRFWIALAVACSFGVSGTVRADAHPASPKQDIVNDIAIRKLYDEFTAAWNRHDVPALAKMWTIDADHVEPDGRIAKGRGEIETLLLRQHATVFNTTQLKLKIDQIYFVTGEVALVDGTYEVAGIRDPQGHPVGTRQGRLTSVLLKEDGRWWITADRLMVPAPLPWRTDKP